MVKGEASQVKVHYKGKEDDFIVFVESSEIVTKYKTDKTIPLVDVVGSFKVFVTHGHGTQGTFDAASKSTLENEFGTSKDEDVIKQILEKGSVQESESAARQGTKNDSMGSRAAH